MKVETTSKTYENITRIKFGRYLAVLYSEKRVETELGHEMKETRVSIDLADLLEIKE